MNINDDTADYEIAESHENVENVVDTVIDTRKLRHKQKKTKKKVPEEQRVFRNPEILNVEEDNKDCKVLLPKLLCGSSIVLLLVTLVLIFRMYVQYQRDHLVT